MLIFSCSPRLGSRYRNYPIYKSDEALVIAIAIAMSRAIAISSFFLIKLCISRVPGFPRPAYLVNNGANLYEKL